MGNSKTIFNNQVKYVALSESVDYLAKTCSVSVEGSYDKVFT